MANLEKTGEYTESQDNSWQKMADEISESKNDKQIIDIAEIAPIAEKDEAEFWQLANSVTSPEEAFGWVNETKKSWNFFNNNADRYVLEMYKRFGNDMPETIDERYLSEVINRQDEHTELIDQLGISDERKQKIAEGLLEKVDFMADDLLENPEKFATFFKQHGVEDMKEPLLKRWGIYYACDRKKNGKEFLYWEYQDNKESLAKMSEKCQNNLPAMMKNIEGMVDLVKHDFDPNHRYEVVGGWLGTEHDHDFYREYPLPLCDKDALDKLNII